MEAVLPRQIQAQVAEADRLQTEIQAPPPGETIQESAPPVPEPAPAAVTAPVPQEPTASEPVQQDAEFHRRRYETLEGKYRSEVPQLHATIRELTAQQQALAAQVTELTKKPAPEAPKPEPLVTEKDVDKFGGDLIDVMRKVAREVTQEAGRPIIEHLMKVDSYLKVLAPKVERATQVEKAVVGEQEQRFFDSLTQAVPDWEAINVDPRWLTWLNEEDAFSGEPRQQLLAKAQAKFNAKPLISLFNAFKATLPAPAAARPSGQSELERQVAPRRSSTSTPTPPAERRFTGSDYHYWLDPRRNRDQKPDELKAMLAELERAAGAARIDWSR